MDVFNTEAIKADMELEKTADESAFESCHAWSVAALNGFLEAAQEVGTPIVELDMASGAVRAAGIAMTSWPTAKKGDRTVAEYHRIVSGDAKWGGGPAQDGSGLTIASDGQIYLERAKSTTEDAATWICQVTDSDLDTAKAVFDSALKGQPMAVA